MQPRLLSCLRAIPIPGTPFMKDIQSGRIESLTEQDAVQEVRNLIALLQLKQTAFRADHSSNVLPLKGRFPHDKNRLLAECDQCRRGTTNGHEYI